MKLFENRLAMGARSGRFGLLLLLSLAAGPDASAHGGGLNADGCHNNRKTGDYHCHRAQVAAAPPPKQESAAGTPSQHLLPEQPSAQTCYTGPRGGTYTLTRSGKKNYGGC